MSSAEYLSIVSSQHPDAFNKTDVVKEDFTEMPLSIISVFVSGIIVLTKKMDNNVQQTKPLIIICHNNCTSDIPHAF